MNNFTWPDDERWGIQMTNGMTFWIDVIRTPPPILLFLSWGVSGLTTLITIPLAIARLRRAKTVFRIIAVNRVVALGSGLASISSLIGQVNCILWMQGTMAPGDAATALEARGVSTILTQLSVTVLLCGMNALIATGLSQKWREPQPPSAGDVATRAAPQP